MELCDPISTHEQLAFGQSVKDFDTPILVENAIGAEVKLAIHCSPAKLKSAPFEMPHQFDESSAELFWICPAP